MSLLHARFTRLPNPAERLTFLRDATGMMGNQRYSFMANSSNCVRHVPHP